MSRLMTYAGALLALAAPLGQASAASLFGLSFDLFSGGYAISTFDSAASGTETSRGTISGLAAGTVLVGLDLRPANRTLYSLASNGTVYALTASGGGYSAVSTGSLSTALTGTDFGFDFNPTVDRLRIISNSNQNLRHAIGGATITDTAVTRTDSAIPSNIDIVGSAYTNNRAGATTTTLYAIDTVTDSLLRATNANGGTYVTVGSLGILQGLTNFNDIGFDVSGVTGEAFLNVDAMLYSVNLTTGAATQLGTIGAGELIDITAAGVPEPASWAMMIGGFGAAGGMLRRRRSVAMRERFA